MDCLAHGAERHPMTLNVGGMIVRRLLRGFLAVAAFVATAAAGWLAIALLAVAVEGQHFSDGTGVQHAAIEFGGPLIVICLALLAAIGAYRGLASWEASLHRDARRD